MVYTKYTVFRVLLPTKLLPFSGVDASRARKFVFCTDSEDSGDGARPDDTADWSERDWEDYNYVPQAGGAGGGHSAGMRDPLAKLCDTIPGLEAGDITALLRDLPIPKSGNVPGMTVEEAIEVTITYIS